MSPSRGLMQCRGYQWRVPTKAERCRVHSTGAENRMAGRDVGLVVPPLAAPGMPGCQGAAQQRVARTEDAGGCWCRSPPNPSVTAGRGGGARLCPSGAQSGGCWHGASSANPNLIFPGPTPVSMETAGSRNREPESRNAKPPASHSPSWIPAPRSHPAVPAGCWPRGTHAAPSRSGCGAGPPEHPAGLGCTCGLAGCGARARRTAHGDVHGTGGWARHTGMHAAHGYGHGVWPGGTAGRGELRAGDSAGSTVHRQVQTTSAHICASRSCTGVGVWCLCACAWTPV